VFISNARPPTPAGHALPPLAKCDPAPAHAPDRGQPLPLRSASPGANIVRCRKSCGLTSAPLLPDRCGC